MIKGLAKQGKISCNYLSSVIIWWDIQDGKGKHTMCVVQLQALELYGYIRIAEGLYKQWREEGSVNSNADQQYCGPAFTITVGCLAQVVWIISRSVLFADGLSHLSQVPFDL